MIPAEVLEEIRKKIARRMGRLLPGSEEDIAQKAVAVLEGDYQHKTEKLELMQIANGIARHLRATEIKKRIREPQMPENLRVQAREGNLEDIEKKILMDQVRKAMSELTPPCPELFKLLLEGHSLPVIADRMGTSSETTHTRRHRCVNALRDKLGPPKRK